MWLQTSKNHSDEQLVNGENKLKAYVDVYPNMKFWLIKNHRKTPKSMQYFYTLIYDTVFIEAQRNLENYNFKICYKVTKISKDF